MRVDRPSEGLLRSLQPAPSKQYEPQVVVDLSPFRRQPRQVRQRRSAQKLRLGRLVVPSEIVHHPQVRQRFDFEPPVTPLPRQRFLRAVPHLRLRVPPQPRLTHPHQPQRFRKIRIEPHRLFPQRDRLLQRAAQHRLSPQGQPLSCCQHRPVPPGRTRPRQRRVGRKSPQNLRQQPALQLPQLRQRPRQGAERLPLGRQRVPGLHPQRDPFPRPREPPRQHRPGPDDPPSLTHRVGRRVVPHPRQPFHNRHERVRTDRIHTRHLRQCPRQVVPHREAQPVIVRRPVLVAQR